MSTEAVRSTGGALVGVGRRHLSVLDCVGIGINGIIGSGIFLLPSVVFRHAGGRSPLAWLIVGGLCFLVGLCFAEAASTTDRSGGPYAYAREAFGSEVGYAVGFIALSSTVLSYATVARGFTDQLAYFLPSVAGREVLVGAAIIGTLAAANLAGIKPAAWASDLFSGAKLIPLLGFVVVGFFFVDFTRLGAPAVPRPGESVGLVPAAMAGLFACTGFEFVSVPAGETRDPSRALPLALLGSLGGSVLLYVLVQLVAVGVTPSLGEARPALAVAAAHAVGPMGARILVLGALVSAFGFCSGSALIGPSYLAAFARDGMAPAALGVRNAQGSPIYAVLAYAGAAVVLGNLGDFNRLADISNIAVVAQYIPTCIAVLVLRARRVPARFRLPGGPLVPLSALAGCLVFLSAVKGAEARVAAEVLAIGVGSRIILGLARKLRARSDGGQRPMGRDPL